MSEPDSRAAAADPDADPAVPRVSLVLVSHSARLAEGVAELAGQMAPDVTLIAAGGSDDGGLGTSFDRITAALAGLSAAGAVVLYDLGSALLTTETALELLDGDEASRIELVDAPLVEGAVAAAVAAQSGADRAAVAAAARSAGGSPVPAVAATDTDAPVRRQTLALRNRLGLHARPAAELVRALTGLDSRVTVTGPDGTAVDVRSVLSVIRLGVRGGDQVQVETAGPDANRALDVVANLISSGFGELSAGPADDPGSVAGAPGTAVGRVQRVRVTAVPQRRADDAADEAVRLQAALTAAQQRLDRGDPISRAHGVLLGDPALAAAAAAALDQGWSAETAWWRAIEAETAAMTANSDPIVVARGVDVRDAGAAVLTELGLRTDRVPADADGLILLADDLGPAEVTDFSTRGGAGIVLTRGTATAHAVVVARGLGLPLVLGRRTVDGADLDRVPDGTLVAIDGGTGRIELNPSEAEQAVVTIAADTEPVTVAGRRILVAANIGSVAEARAAVGYGADGVGLLRTELLMLDRPELPDEAGQVADLTEIFQVLGDRPVIVRVLDAGGDKPVRALQLDPLLNGFLGVRGVRWLLANPAVLRTQLRAVCRAAVGHQVSVMAPMISVADEAVAFRQAVEDALQSLADDGLPHARPVQIGVMVEVPAAALAADELSVAADFLSIGTNDLIAYTMAADRTQPSLAGLLDPHRTAIRRLLEQLCQRAGVPVHVCGELAADPGFASWLVGHGVTELSMAAPRIPAIKQSLRAGRPDAGAAWPR